MQVSSNIYQATSKTCAHIGLMKMLQFFSCPLVVILIVKPLQTCKNVTTCGQQQTASVLYPQFIQSTNYSYYVLSFRLKFHLKEWLDIEKACSNFFKALMHLWAVVSSVVIKLCKVTCSSLDFELSL